VCFVDEVGNDIEHMYVATGSCWTPCVSTGPHRRRCAAGVPLVA